MKDQKGNMKSQKGALMFNCSLPALTTQRKAYSRRSISINTSISEKEGACQAPKEIILNKLSYDLEVGPDFAINTKEMVDFSVFKPCFKFRSNVFAYLRDLPESCQRVLAYLLRYKKATRIVVKNKTIASSLGYSTKTITRATNRLMDDGLLYKFQVNNWAPNEYMLSPVLSEGKTSFDIWLNNLSEKQQEAYMYHEILPNGGVSKSMALDDLQGNVPHNINVSKREYIYKKEVTRGHAQVHYYPEKGMSSMENKYGGHNNTSKTSKQGSNLKGVELFGIRKSISMALQLGASQKLKLFAFQDSCLSEVFGKIKCMSFRSTQKGYEELLAQALQWCERNKMPPDIVRYKKLCASQGVVVEKEKYSYKVKKQAPMYKPYVPEETKLTIKQLLYERDNWSRIIKEHKEKPNLLIDMVKLGTSQLKSIEKELAERINQGESVV